MSGKSLGEISLEDFFMSARTIMIQGTASHVGKSVVTAGLCRMLAQDGFHVAPFKSQNMSNNSYVTPDGGEIGRAQAAQAQAAGIPPTVYMNPILLKPESDHRAQVVVLGRPFQTMRAREYQFKTASLLDIVEGALNQLMRGFEVVVIEGAGSPAEINLKDIVNMQIAEMADAPVILVGDIDRGGVFASLIGTLELLEPKHRARVKAFLINKFRGDLSLLEPGLRFLEARTGIPVLGVLPYMERLGIMEEDGLSDERIARNGSSAGPGKISIDVIWLPHISNHTDFEPFEFEDDCSLTYLRELPNRFPDVLILPGTKSTVSDLQFLRDSGFERWIHECAQAGVQIVGICGGYQMLGEKILDPDGVESPTGEIHGFGLIPATTVFKSSKMTRQVQALHIESGETIHGYEIHMGETYGTGSPLGQVFIVNSESNLSQREPVPALSACVRNGQIWGTYLHGIFESAGFRRHFLNALRQKKGWSQKQSVSSVSFSREDAYDRLADLIRSNINCNLFYEILNQKKTVTV